MKLRGNASGLYAESRSASDHEGPATDFHLPTPPLHSQRPSELLMITEPHHHPATGPPVPPTMHSWNDAECWRPTSQPGPPGGLHGCALLAASLSPPTPALAYLPLPHYPWTGLSFNGLKPVFGGEKAFFCWCPTPVASMARASHILTHVCLYVYIPTASPEMNVTTTRAPQFEKVTSIQLYPCST